MEQLVHSRIEHASVRDGCRQYMSIHAAGEGCAIDTRRTATEKRRNRETKNSAIWENDEGERASAADYRDYLTSLTLAVSVISLS